MIYGGFSSSSICQKRKLWIEINQITIYSCIVYLSSNKQLWTKLEGMEKIYFALSCLVAWKPDSSANYCNVQTCLSVCLSLCRPAWLVNRDVVSNYRSGSIILIYTTFSMWYRGDSSNMKRSFYRAQHYMPPFLFHLWLIGYLWKYKTTEPNLSVDYQMMDGCFFKGLTFTTQALVLLSKIVCFLTFLKFYQLFHELINKYQACLYLFQCISHGGSKYGHEIPQFWLFFTKFVKFLTRHLHSSASWKALIYCKCTWRHAGMVLYIYLYSDVS